MFYKVNAGALVRWPDGQVRARAGEVFDGYDTVGTPRQRVLARVWMRGQWDACMPDPEATVATALGNGMPDAFFEVMRALRHADDDVVTREVDMLVDPPKETFDAGEPDGA